MKLAAKVKLATLFFVGSGLVHRERLYFVGNRSAHSRRSSAVPADNRMISRHKRVRTA